MTLLPIPQLLFCVLLTLTFAVSLPVGSSLFSLQRNGLLHLSSSLSGQSKGAIGKLEKDLNLVIGSGGNLIEPGVNIQRSLYTRNNRDSPAPHTLPPSVKASGVTDTCTDIDPTNLPSELPRTESSKAEITPRQISNGLYKRLNPVVELWHRITGKQEEEPYLEVRISCYYIIGIES